MLFFKKQKKILAVCFDLDNTLCDFTSAETLAEVHLAKSIQRKFKIHPNDFLKEYNITKNIYLYHDLEPAHYSRALWLSLTLQRIGKKISADGSKKMEVEFWEYLKPRIKLYPSTIDVLEHLKENNIVILILANSDGVENFKLHRIESLGISKYITNIITSDDTRLNKPAIENFEYVKKILTSSPGQIRNPEQILMVGDHPDVDLVNAKRSGMRTCWINPLNLTARFNYVDYYIRDIKEIIDIVK